MPAVGVYPPLRFSVATLVNLIKIKKRILYTGDAYGICVPVTGYAIGIFFQITGSDCVT